MVFAKVNLLESNCTFSFHCAAVINAAVMPGDLLSTKLDSCIGERIWCL